jgi:hypothetical protein
MTRLRGTTSFLSNVFSKKYPGRKLVKSREDKYLNQFSEGIEANSNIDPLKTGTTRTIAIDNAVNA